MISGFSKLSKDKKIDFIVDQYLDGSRPLKEQLQKSQYQDADLCRIIDEFSENTIGDFHIPFGVAPNILINEKSYCIPMAIEESSVVAAAAKAGKFWYERGGFRAEVISTVKSGQVHLIIGNADDKILANFFAKQKSYLLQEVEPLTANMKKRGGGLVDLKLKNCCDIEAGYYQLWADFETCDAMGANFINTVLEELAALFKNRLNKIHPEFDVNVVMSILSNYTPECLVKAWVSCPLSELEDKDLGMSAKEFSFKFKQAVRIAQIDVNRATTHNKGIMNGIDAVVVATGNDFRAVEACAHAYAARSGRYQSLTTCHIENDTFHFSIELPLSLGTVGGLTALHPMARLSLALLGNPSAADLMEVVAVAGLTQNFAALKSLVTTGIQKGHMKMHLMNILSHMGANDSEREEVRSFFHDKVITFNHVRQRLEEIRKESM
jgi:hydroxymethylglutaryl-CoA reductase